MHIVIQLIVFILILVAFSLSWGEQNFENISFNEIVFTLNMPLKGASNEYYISYFYDALCPTIGVFVAELFLYFLPAKKQISVIIKGKRLTSRIKLVPVQLNIVLWIIIFIVSVKNILVRADNSFELFDYVRNQIQASNFIEEEYVSPDSVSIDFPENKRNLIWIFMESAETTNQDVKNGGWFPENYTPEMTEMAKMYTSFSQSELIEGAAVAPACGWTIAGLVAQTSGVPLKLYKYDDAKIDNSMNDYASFLPGVISLGEILSDEGYKNYFMAGSDFAFGGREDYFSQHGGYEIWDYYSAIEEGKIDESYKVKWGFEDQKLYDYAKEKVVELAESGQPFNFSMLTVDTHTGGGYVCELCEDKYESQYANVIACSSKQVYEFVEWIQQQDFYENTTIVITGDHASMEQNFYYDMGDDENKEQNDQIKHSGDVKRKVYNVFINAGISSNNVDKNRQFTTLDYFPTVLASIGATIEGNRLGLGTNLFSGEPTLAEEYGYEIIFEELNKKSKFYDNNLLYP